MNKNLLIREVAKRTGLSIRLSRVIVDRLIQTINLALKKGQKVSLKDFGTFCISQKQSRRYYDIPTSRIKTVSARRVVKFAPYKKFKEKLLLKTLNIHKDDDGSIGNYIAFETGIFSVSRHLPTRDLNIKNVRIALYRKNISPRKSRKFEVETLDLSFDGFFLFEHFLGENEHREFPSLKTPHKETPILKPIIDMLGTTKGVMEPVLLPYLYSLCREINGIKVLENVKLPILNRNYSYRPDFCICWERKNIYIDIEIDEPYDIVSRKPIHYFANGDNLRDRYFIRNGWCVIRFAEQQIIDDIEGIVNYIKRTLKWLTDENEIEFHKNTLDPIKRWSYEEATLMASHNTREHYLDIPDSIHPDDSLAFSNAVDTATDLRQAFKKPAEDILLQSVYAQKESKWLSVVNSVKQSDSEYCVVSKSNGYKWIFTKKSLEISSKDGIHVITGQSPLGFENFFPLDKIVDIIPLKELFSDVHWESKSTINSKDYEVLNRILFDAIVKGKPIWIAYHSNNSGFSTRFLSNIAYCWHRTCFLAPHIGLGHCVKYGMHSLSHFYAYCSNRKEFRMFAADSRIERIKVLNCDYVYFVDDEYADSFARLIMCPYENNNGNAFFENAEEILRIMPKNEKETLFVQGNLANLYVMKGEMDKAIATYQQKPFDSFISPSLTWGESCFSDIHFFISLCKEHLNDGHFYDGLDAKIMLHNFKKVLKLLTESSWMQDSIQQRIIIQK